MQRFPEFSDKLITSLRQALAVTDQIAYANVTHDDQGQSILDANGHPIKGKFSRGGPFGALLGISLKDGSFEVVGQPRGNNVVGSGIASRHAEDQALQPDNYRSLANRLRALKDSDQEPLVWMISSGQSCTNCHTKQEIAARDLESRKLIKPGQFMTLYGATYDETFKVAQFYDAQYADAMIHSSLAPQRQDNLIRQERIGYHTTPKEVQEILANASLPTAVVVRQGHVYAVGTEARTQFDPYATAEVNAIRAACTRNRKDGAFASWAIDGDLYTTNAEIGSLLFAEAGWTKIGVVKSVQMPKKLAARQFETRETQEISNGEFLRIVAGGYQHPMSSIRVLRDESFNNTAQPKWAEMLRVNGEQLYNGAAVSPGVEATRNTHTRFRFAAQDLCNCAVGGMAHRPVKPLDVLAVHISQIT